jgi:hypothetical protein
MWDHTIESSGLKCLIDAQASVRSCSTPYNVFSKFIIAIYQTVPLC